MSGRKRPMDLAMVLDRVESIMGHGSDWNPHMSIHVLCVDVLSAIAEGKCSDPVGCAIAVSSLWCNEPQAPAGS